MKLSRAAELQVLLEGVPLPTGREDLVRYARHEGGRPLQLEALASLPARRWHTIDEIAEHLASVQPSGHEEPHRPRTESGAPPGGSAYTDSSRS